MKRSDLKQTREASESVSRESGGGEATPVKSCCIESSQSLDIVFWVLERSVTVKTSGNNKWKLR